MRVEIRARHGRLTCSLEEQLERRLLFALARFGERTFVVWNKSDAATGPFGPPGALAVSALGGAGIEDLTEAVLAGLDYRAPERGKAVPFTGDQAEALARAQQLVAEAKIDAAREVLASL